MRLIFAGTPDFAVPCLEALIAAGHEVVAVYTQPDRPAGRGRKLQPSPVKACALRHHLPVHQPETLKNEAGQLEAFNADAMIVVAYGLILPASILAIPKFGCLNVHASLLPRWRGAAPIQRALEEGDRQTGVTIMQMDAGLDTGDMLLTATTAIGPNDTGGTLHDRLASLGAEALVAALARLANGQLARAPQDDNLATYARKLSKSEGEIDWRQPADLLQRKVRAFEPWPGSSCTWGQRKLRIRQATAIDVASADTPGTVVHADNDGIDIATGDGQLRIERLQLAGGKPQSAREFLNGHALRAGDRLH
ncbi:MAG: methionyl-tRNA formyltransferase [Thiotrichales bacterium SG8_50]|nr:MAG: methionyl-tRNA formyltransferase [Thiotrichales bacterium SG8_50]